MKTTKEIAQEIKEYFKPMAKTHGLKLSIRTEYKHISVYLMSFNEEIIKEDDFFKQYGYKQINHFYISSSESLTNAGKSIFGMIKSIIDKYHYDRSDIMTDYFDTNFYISFGVGCFDKKFELAR